jgi:hypothetical protein
MKIIVLAHPKDDHAASPRDWFARSWKEAETGKEKFMSNEDNRVLNRKGARRLTAQEIAQITGGKITPLTLMLTGSSSGMDESPDQ